MYAEVAPTVFDALAGGSLSVAELRKLLHADADVSAVVALLCDEGRLVRDRPMGSRKSSAFRYRRWDEALPDVDLAAYDEAEATRLLVRHYVAAYGPVTVADIVWWSGLPATRIRDAVADLTDETVAVSVRDLDGQFLMTREEFEAASAGRHGRAATISLLPELDPYTMGYRDRARFLDPTHQDMVFDRGGNATSVVLIDGHVVGVWDLTEQPVPAARVLLFDRDLRARRRILDRAAATGEFWFGAPVPVDEYTSMVPLTERSGVMRQPLDGAQPAGTTAS